MPLPHFGINMIHSYCRNCYFDFTYEPIYSNMCPCCNNIIDNTIRTYLIREINKYKFLYLRLKKLKRLF